METQRVPDVEENPNPDSVSASDGNSDGNSTGGNPEVEVVRARKAAEATSGT